MMFNYLQAQGDTTFATIKLDGSFQGKSLYIQNDQSTLTESGKCVVDITVNGKKAPWLFDADAFEVNLEKCGLAIGDSVSIVIYHATDCLPRVLNTYNCHPKSTFEIEKMHIDTLPNLIWITSKEEGKLPFIVEQFRWNKWIAIGEIDGVGKAHAGIAYNFDLRQYIHSGKNTFRVRQVSATGKPRYSQSISYESGIEPIMCGPKKVIDTLRFEDETMYELYDTNGNIVQKGKGMFVNFVPFKKGIYYLNYDNVNKRVIKQ